MSITQQSPVRGRRTVAAPATEPEVAGLDLDALKTGGIIKQRQKDLFTLRLKCPGGRVPLERLARILDVARKYGGDYVHVSVRQSIEIPYINFADIETIRRELADVGQEIASCGPRVRVPTACGGCEYNPRGLTNTQQMAAKVCDLFFGKQALPHKFKITFSGCPNDCVRTNTADLGFQGAVKPRWNAETCIACGLCVHSCRESAIRSDPETRLPVLVPENCLACGDCIRACPTDSWQAETTGWVVRCGGKHGRHPINGSVIARFVPDERVPVIIEAILAWYDAHGRDRGRLRLGTMLLDATVWREFLADIQPALGDYAVPNPPPPQANEIHRTLE